MSEQIQAPKSNVSASEIDPTRRHHGAWWVIGSLGICSLILGILAFYNMKRSVVSIDQTQKSMAKAGLSLPLEGCADRVFAWNNMCGAIHVMCRASIHRVMASCLEAKPRLQACQKLRMEQYKSSAHFQYARCEARGLHRRRHWKRECGVVYATVWSYCQYWLDKNAKPLGQKVEKKHTKKSIPPKT